MPRYEITSPDGKRFEITAPDGATQEQILAYAQQQFAQPKRDIAAEIANDPISQGARGNLDPRKAAARDLLLNNPENGKSPAELLGDLAYWSGGKVTDFATGLGAKPEVAAGFGTAANALVNAAPMVVGGEMAKTFAPVFDWAGKKTMLNALNPTMRDMLLGKGERAAKTMLDEGVNVSEGGVRKLQGIGSKLNAEVDALINGSPAQINKYAVESRVRGPEQTFRLQANPQDDLQAIERASNQFLSHPDLTGRVNMPVRLAQELKQGTYKQLRDKYGELGNASTEAQKALARGLREEIEAAVPGVAGTNAKASDIWNALSVAERGAATGAKGPQNSLAFISANPKAAAYYEMSKSKLLKSAIARALYSGQEQIPANIARIGIGAATYGDEQ